MTLNIIGEHCQDIYATLNDTGDDYLSVLETLKPYFVPLCNVSSYERHVFNSCNQETGETMNAYVTRLRVLSKTCDFGEGIHEGIRDQVVHSCFSNELRKRFFESRNFNM